MGMGMEMGMGWANPIREFGLEGALHRLEGGNTHITVPSFACGCVTWLVQARGA